MNDLLRHPSEKELLLAADGELPEPETARIEAHLKACWVCRGLRHDIESAIATFVSVHGAMLDSRIPPSGPSRALLTARLSALYSKESELPQSWWSRIRLVLSRAPVSNVSLLLPCAVALGLSATMALLFTQRSQSKVAAGDVLARAAVLETQTTRQAEPGVVCQKLVIRTSKRAFERSVYSDVEGQRHPRLQTLGADDAQLRAELAIAGVSWEEPLSAITYKRWHDRQIDLQDEVRQGERNVTITTSVASGAVAQESLTVRSADFHPLRRSVEFRNEENVEITEVNYQLLSWNDIDADIFEPSSEMARATRVQPQLPMLTRAEIDEAELQARLALNHLNADMGERIEIVRKATGIEIKGIVETDERKRELLGSLRPLPHVATSIFSFEDMKSRPRPESKITSIKAYSVVARPSPLERYLAEKSWQRDQISQLHQQLLNAAIAIHQESKAIAELLERFEGVEGGSDTAQDALNQLVSDHKVRLISRLDEEQNLIGRIEIPARTLNASLPTSASPDAVNLRKMAERNFTLCTQLTSGTDAPPPVQSLVFELADSIAQLRAIATAVRAHADLPGHQSLGNK
jgi:hypothetical protein